jgi:hypothetical protein
VYNWSRPIPTSLKIIHSCVATLGTRRRAAARLADALWLYAVSRRRRMYAQALTISALLAAAGVELYGAQHGLAAKPQDNRNEYTPHPPARAAELARHR